MKFISLEPFVPSGNNFERSKQLFQELGFTVNWDAGDYVGFQRDDCKFILQKFNNREFAENFMLSVKVSSVDEFWKEVNENDHTAWLFFARSSENPTAASIPMQVSQRVNERSRPVSTNGY